MIENLPEKTIERLSKYRRALIDCHSKGKTFIFSHELAKIIHITPVQVRHDLMLIDYTGTLRKGYDVDDLINRVSNLIDPDQIQKLALIGIGNLGKAIISYFNGKRPKLKIIAAFDNDYNKVNRLYAGIKCYHVNHLIDVISKEGITMAILTVPPEQSVRVSETLIKAKIKGVLNFTPTPLNFPDNIYLEEYDIITSLEKVSFFSQKLF